MCCQGAMLKLNLVRSERVDLLHRLLMLVQSQPVQSLTLEDICTRWQRLQYSLKHKHRFA